MKILRKQTVAAGAAIIAAGAIALVTIPASADETPIRLHNGATADCLASFLQSDPGRTGYVYSEPCPAQGVHWKATALDEPAR